MRLFPFLGLCVLQSPPAQDPHSLSEWDLLTHPSIWGEPGEPWKSAPMWPGVTGGSGIDGPYWREPHVPATPIEPDRWSIPDESARGNAAWILAPWFLDPDTAVAMPEEPDPRKPKETADAGFAPWSNLEPLGERRPACAFTNFTSPREEVRMARVDGARWFLLNGEPFIADRERRGFEGVPVLVRKGPNRVFVAADGEPFHFSLLEPRSTIQVERFDVAWPGGRDSLDDEVGLNVFNASTDTIRCLHTHYGHVSGWNVPRSPCLTDWRDGGLIAPLAMTRTSFYYADFGTVEPVASDVDHGCRYNPVSVFACDGSPSERMLLRRGSEWASRRPNNMSNVERKPGGETRDMAGLLLDTAIHVYATGREDLTLIRARFLQQRTWYDQGSVPILARDDDVVDARKFERPLSHEIRRGQLVLHGNGSTNLCWRSEWPDEAGLKVVEGRAEFQGHAYEGDDLAGWLLFERSEGSGVAAIFDTGTKGARLAVLLATTWSGPRSDFAIFRVDPERACGWTRLDAMESR